MALSDHIWPNLLYVNRVHIQQFQSTILIHLDATFSDSFYVSLGNNAEGLLHVPIK